MKIYNIITGDDPSTAREVRAFFNSMYSWEDEVEDLVGALKHEESKDEQDLKSIEHIKRLSDKTPEEVTTMVKIRGKFTEYHHTILMNLATTSKGQYNSEIRRICYLFMLSDKDGHQVWNTERFPCAHDLIEYIK